ncbi:CPBP family intramembrane metalloprotease [Staphylococcus pseudoxylosus]|uniref:CPBP family intramembrane glutamic endopeptidase n=1 Tax=Staphylococcus pseudoxylosus TaxID=2282419 RepID=UPI002DBC8F22|nr:CPBP family intramembrane glutamic endopeptidase [Staphylococcus pseudoxylosus]MEB8085649.1 CPBP family intramembrane metalloprotease [Staphylococcus pseudoxylosus]
MSTKNFRLTNLIIYIIITSLIFIISTNTTQLFDGKSLPNDIPQLFSGLLFTLFTISFILFIYKKKNKNIVRDIGLLNKVNRPLIFTLALPIILFMLSIILGFATGTLQNLSLNFDISAWYAFLLNILVAFLYEAFPEELLVRGVILSELRKKFSFLSTLFLLPLVFALIGLLSHAFSTLIATGNLTPPPLIILIQFYIFGIALQLYREYSNSIWPSVLFHLICLELTRYVFNQQNNPIILFNEPVTGIMLLIGLFLTMYLGSIVTLSVLIFLRRKN